MSVQLSEGQNFALGTFAALIEGLILQPTVYWKNAKAQNLPFTLDPRLLYRGTGASIFNECQMMGIQFGLVGLFQKILLDFTANEKIQQNSNDPRGLSMIGSLLSGREEMLSASLGGVFGAFVSSPVELIMIQQQLFGGNSFAVPLRISREYGIFNRGMMRGMLTASLRDAIYVSGMLGVTPIAQTYLTKHYDMAPNTACMYSSFLGGMVAAVPSHPLDVAKTCMQGDLARKNYLTLTQTLKSLWSQGGVRRLFSGVSWRTINIVSTVFIANLCMNHFGAYASRLNI